MHGRLLLYKNSIFEVVKYSTASAGESMPIAIIPCIHRGGCWLWDKESK